MQNNLKSIPWRFSYTNTIDSKQPKKLSLLTSARIIESLVAKVFFFLFFNIIKIYHIRPWGHFSTEKKKEKKQNIKSRL